MAFSLDKANRIAIENAQRFSVNKATGTNVATFQKFSIKAVVYDELVRDNITRDVEVQNDETGIVSLLSTPVLSYLEFPTKTYGNINDLGSIRNALGVFIDTVIFEVRRSKNIIKTATVGSQGTIKEYIGADDYEITATCIITGETVDTSANFGKPDLTSSENSIQLKRSIGNRYPQQDVNNLVNYMNVPSAVTVISPLLNDYFGIYDVVIQDYEFIQEEGASNYQKVIINMVSDEPIVIQQA